MKEQITTNLLITHIKNEKKEIIICWLIRLIGITAIAAYITSYISSFSLTILLLLSLTIFIIITAVIMYNGRTLIRQIRCNNIDIYEDEVIKKAVINGRKYYLVFKNYRHSKGPGVVVSEKQYNECDLTPENNHYYIICVKTTNKNSYLLLYPTKNYVLDGNMVIS